MSTADENATQPVDAVADDVGHQEQSEDVASDEVEQDLDAVQDGDNAQTDVQGDDIEPEPIPESSEPEPDPNVVQVTLNGREIEARKGELVIEAAARHDAYIPHFCYHPRMKSVGMCRQCLVEIDTGRGPQVSRVVHDHRSRRT